MRAGCDSSRPLSFVASGCDNASPMAAHARQRDQRQNERRVMVVTCLAHCMAHMYMLVFPAVVTPLRQELSMSLGEVVQLSLASYLLYGLGALPAGMLTDRWSARWMLFVCCALSGLGALAAAASQSPLQLALALSLMGIGTSIYHPTGMALISRTFSDRRGRALGLNGVFGNVGLAAAPFVAGLLAAMLGWRWAYGLLALLGIAGALLVVLLPIKEEAASALSSKPADAAPVSTARYFVVLCVAMTLGGLAYRASSLVLPSYFEERATFLLPLSEWVMEAIGGSGSKMAAATTLTSLVYLVGILGQVIGGRIADAKELRLSYLGFHLATLLPLLGVAYLFELPLFVAAGAYLLFALGMQPIENSLVAKLSPPKWRSTAYGLKFVLSFGVGALAVELVRIVVARAGLSPVFACVLALEIALVSVAFGLWLVSRKQLPRVSNK